MGDDGEDKIISTADINLIISNASWLKPKGSMGFSNGDTFPHAGGVGRIYIIGCDVSVGFHIFSVQLHHAANIGFAHIFFLARRKAPMGIILRNSAPPSLVRGAARRGGHMHSKIFINKGVVILNGRDQAANIVPSIFEVHWIVWIETMFA